MTGRIVSPSTLRKVMYQRDRTCLYGLYHRDPCKGGLAVHHINKRSQMGDDVPENLITLCAKHHDMAEKREIKPEEFTKILEYFGAAI